MTDSERESWRRIRARGQAAFVAAMVVRRCLWLAVPVVVAVALSGFLSGQSAGFWTDLPSLIWMFAGVTLLIGIGDGFFLWRLREREYERNLYAGEPSAPAPPARPNGARELKAGS
jgi:peptidoglycan/LPS O-acetylase OafA/YrhL